MASLQTAGSRLVRRVEAEVEKLQSTISTLDSILDAAAQSLPKVQSSRDSLPASLFDHPRGAIAHSKKLVALRDSTIKTGRRELRLYRDALQAFRKSHGQLAPLSEVLEVQGARLNRTLSSSPESLDSDPTTSLRQDGERTLRELGSRAGEFRAARADMRAKMKASQSTLFRIGRTLDALETGQINVAAEEGSISADEHRELVRGIDQARDASASILARIANAEGVFAAYSEDITTTEALVQRILMPLDELSDHLRTQSAKIRRLEGDMLRVRRDANEDIAEKKEHQMDLSLDPQTGLPLADRGLVPLVNIFQQHPPMSIPHASLKTVATSQSSFATIYGKLQGGPVAQLAHWMNPFSVAVGCFVLSKDEFALASLAATLASCSVRAGVKTIVHVPSLSALSLLDQAVASDVNAVQLTQGLKQTFVSLDALRAQYEIKGPVGVSRKASSRKIPWRKDIDPLHIHLLPLAPPAQSSRCVILRTQVPDTAKEAIAFLRAVGATGDSKKLYRACARRDRKNLTLCMLFNLSAARVAWVPPGRRWWRAARRNVVRLKMDARQRRDIRGVLKNGGSAWDALVGAEQLSDDFFQALRRVAATWSKLRRKGGVQVIYTGSSLSGNAAKLAASLLRALAGEPFGFHVGSRGGDGSRSSVMVVSNQAQWKVARAALEHEVSIIIVPSADVRLDPPGTVGIAHLVMPLDPREEAQVVNRLGAMQVVAYTRAAVSDGDETLGQEVRGAFLRRQSEVFRVLREAAVNEQALRLARKSSRTQR